MPECCGVVKNLAISQSHYIEMPLRLPAPHREAERAAQANEQLAFVLEACAMCGLPARSVRVDDNMRMVRFAASVGARSRPQSVIRFPAPFAFGFGLDFSAPGRARAPKRPSHDDSLSLLGTTANSA